MANLINLRKRPPTPARPEESPARQANNPDLLIEDPRRSRDLPQQSPEPVRAPAKPVLQDNKREKPRTSSGENTRWTASLQQIVYGKTIIWILGLVLVTGLVLLQFEGSLLLIALIVFASGMILFARIQPAKESTIEIHEAGINIDGHNRYWKDFHSFWIEYNPGGIQELSLQLRKPYLPRLSIPLAGQDPMKIRGALIPFIPEEEHELSVIDAILKRR